MAPCLCDALDLVLSSLRDGIGSFRDQDLLFQRGHEGRRGPAADKDLPGCLSRATPVAL